jgi:acyl-CoA synthetase (AMP-forming)/AMP-acid ligase II
MVRSEYADVPPVELPIHDAVLARAAEFGDIPALIDGTDGTTLTYEQVDRFHRRVAAALAAAGVGKGDVLALHSPNTIAFPTAFYAARRAGATVTTVHPLATAQEFAKQLTDCAARWIITVSPLLDIARRAAELAGGVREIFVCDGATGHRSLIDMLACAAPEPQVAIDPVEDVAALPYSSGTTGTPKGVMLTHRQIATNLAQLDPAIPAGPGDRVLAVLPFFHIYGLTALMNAPLRQGATVVVLPRFDLEQFLAAIQNHRITALYVAPPIVLALAKHPVVAQYDLSSLKYVVSAAAPLDARLAACSQRLGLPPVGQAYGMTELSPLTIAVPRVPNGSATDREYSVTTSDAFEPLRSRTSTAGLAGSQVCGAGVRLLGGTPPLALTGAATVVEAEKPIREGRAPSRSRWGGSQQVQGLPGDESPVHGGPAKTKPLPWVRQGAPAVSPGAPRRPPPEGLDLTGGRGHDAGHRARGPLQADSARHLHRRRPPGGLRKDPPPTAQGARMTLMSRARARAVETLTLDSPHNRNALSAALVGELAEALADAGRDTGVRAIVLTHTGNTFSAGADLRDPPPPEALVGLLRQIVELPKPVVARVTGHVRAGGLGLLAACDIAAASTEATFAFTEVRIGVAPAVISLPLLPRTDPRALARYYLTGESLDAAEAARTGLLTTHADDVDTALAPILDGLRRSAPDALTETKRLLTARVLEAFDRDAAGLTALSARLFSSPQAREGMTAFLERRDPAWVV